MSAMIHFYSKENLLFVYDIFEEYMQNSFGMEIGKIEDDKNIKKKMFDIMSDIHKDGKNRNLKIADKNIMLLTKTKQHYIKHFQIEDKSESKKPNIQNLSRDKDIYGNRQVVMADKRPSRDPYSRRNEMNEDTDRAMLQRIEVSRDEEIGIKKYIPDSRIIAPLDKDQPESQEDFFKRVREIEDMRSMPQPATMEILDQRMNVNAEIIQATSIGNQDPKALYSNAFIHDTKAQSLTKSHEGNLDELLHDRADTIISNADLRKKKIEKYITINSFDRQWAHDVLRYKYSVSFHSSLNDADSMSRYRDIHSISVSKVVIPEEVFATNSILNQTKSVFNYEFSFSYPYVLLYIDEFSDIYDGTNQYIRKAFATLVYHRNYKAPNGRGYVILKPVQKEKKTFFPSPLLNLSKMSLTIAKPNGDLFNDSADNYKIFKVEYEVFNSQFLKIVTNVYFDKNEFYVGDVINMQRYKILPDSQETRELALFINRSSGHEIREIGAANNNGFFRSFYIEAPGHFDKSQGKFDVHMNLINALNTYNATVNWSEVTDTNGFILNSSLQHSISMTLEVLVNDPGSFQTI